MPNIEVITFTAESIMDVSIPGGEDPGAGSLHLLIDQHPPVDFDPGIRGKDRPGRAAGGKNHRICRNDLSGCGDHSGPADTGGIFTAAYRKIFMFIEPVQQFSGILRSKPAGKERI